jgi:hypothetical protein
MFKCLLSLFANFNPSCDVLVNSLVNPQWQKINNGEEYRLVAPGQFAGKKVFCPPVAYRDANDVLHIFQLKVSDTTPDYVVFENWNPAIGGTDNVDSNPIPVSIELY